VSREEDFELVRRLCSGDPAHAEPAFDVLYAKYRDQVFNLSCRVLHDRALAADATQEAFLSVLRKAHKFKFRSAFSSWLYRVTVNLCIDLKRKVDRKKPLSLSEPRVSSWVGDGDPRREPEPGPEDRARQREFRDAVDHAVNRLNPRLATVVVLRYTEGLGYEEIAQILGVPLGTVKSRLSRAHAALAEDLGPRLDDYV
jgi:RNA polymerase sigma-70 factor (ECF subfamily)